MKKNVRLIVCLLASILVILSASTLLSSCQKEAEIILNVYNWGEYISDGEDGTLNVNAEIGRAS